MASGPPSAPTSRWTTCSRTRISPLSRSFRCTETGSMTVDFPTNPLSSSHTQLQWSGRLSWRPTFWRYSQTPASLPGCTHKTSTSVSFVCSITFLTNTPLLSRREIPPLALLWKPQQNPPSLDRSPYTLPILSILTCPSVCTLVNTPRRHRCSLRSEEHL